MTDEERAWEIIQMRHENEDNGLPRNDVDYEERTDIIAALAAVRAEEREACAKVADDICEGVNGYDPCGVQIAVAIRARGNQ
jgi:hypothetical protein